MKVSIGGVGVRVMLRAGTIAHELPALWLRERSPEPGQADAVTGQRVSNVHLLPHDLRIDVAVQTGDTLSVRFSDGHVADYDCEVLRRQITALNVLPRRSAWRADLTPLPYHAFARLGTDKGVTEAIANLLKYGVVVLTNVPTEPDAIVDIAALFGDVRASHRGRVFTGGVEPTLTTGVGAHSLHPFVAAPNGYSFVQCLSSTAPHGRATVVDALSVVDRLGREDPEALRLLASTAITCRFVDGDREHVVTRPVIELERGIVTSIFYHPLHDSLPLMSSALTMSYHAARQRLAELINKDDFSLNIPVPAGHLVVVDNSRVLFQFVDTEQPSVMQTCSIEGGGPAAIYRVLAARAGRPIDQLPKAPAVWKE